VVGTLIVVYLIGGLAVTFAAYAASNRLADPPGDRLLVSVVAGALWPLLVVGLIELGLVVVCAEILSDTEDATGVYA
jgi:hypothetical protein